MEEAGITARQAAEMLRDMPEPPPVFFRLYYDDQGRVITYSMEDLPGNYIEIDSVLFRDQPRNIRVVDGKIKYIHHNWSQKLVPNDQGTACHPHDVAIVVDHEPLQRWSRKLYESYQD